VPKWSASQPGDVSVRRAISMEDTDIILPWRNITPAGQSTRTRASCRRFFRRPELFTEIMMRKF
jgi:hypothetical protein